ncbi:MAG: hypothetical protein GY930_22580 [bacterium]|nr:hypothetical protein [bacterium]
MLRTYEACEQRSSCGSVGIAANKVSWVLDADIRGFFDAIDHDGLMNFVERRSGDKRVSSHIKKWLNAGVLEDGKKTKAQSGTPQGGRISPLRKYLHALRARPVGERVERDDSTR